MMKRVLLCLTLLTSACADQFTLEALMGTEGVGELRAPLNTTAISLGDSSIRVTWSDPVLYETAFEVGHATSESADFKIVAALPANSTAFVHTGLLPSTTNYYRVQSVRERNGRTILSEFSNVASATTDVGMPTPTPTATPAPTPTPIPGGPATRGYRGRACGFDLNFNGIVGEPGPSGDCNVCDGVTSDVDRNGVVDDLRYVDCNSGSDVQDCSNPVTPCLTVNRAQAVIGAAQANQIQAICVRATCNSIQWTPNKSGAAGTFARAAKVNQTRAFEYPRYPYMLVGWDTDDDGVYPPHDTDQSEPAVFDGNGAAEQLSFFSNDYSQDRIELAHVTLRDYNSQGASVESGGTTLDPNPSGDADHLVFHDLLIATSSAGSEGGWTRAYGGNNANWHVYDNINVPGFAGFVGWRGECVDGTNCGPIRFQNISITKTIGATGSPGGKAWGWWTDIEVLDSTFTCQSTENYGWRVLQCNQGAALINNEFNNCLVAGINIQPGDPDSCDSPAREVTGVVIDRNHINATSSIDGNGRCIMVEDSAGSAGEYLANLSITNNVCSARGAGAAAWDSCFLIGGGTSGSGDLPGAYTIVGNTCSMQIGNGFRPGAIYISDDVIGSATRRQQDFVIRNNIIAGLGSGNPAWFEQPARGNIAAGSNVCDPQGNCQSFEGSLFSCDPIFENAADGDLRLKSSDTCAQSKGVPVPGVPAIDIDGVPRIEPWDIGAYER